MATIDIEHPHSMGKERARQAVEGIADDLRKRLQVEYHWEGNDLLFNRPGATGRIDIGEQKVHVHVDLGLLLSPMKGIVESQIKEYLEGHLR